MNIAILLAAGSGTRLGASLPKQFLEVCGKTILEHTVEAFESSDYIDEIAIVTREDYVEKVSELIGEHHPKLKRILKGGKERYHSSIAAIEAYTNDDDNIMIHDAVRPMVSKRIIRDCVEALRKYDAVDVAVPATDTILQVDENGLICNIPPRRMLRNVQTPQCFKRRVIAEAYRRGLADPAFVTTDDCGVVHRYMPEVPIYIVDGESTNIKITFKEDIKTFESYLNR